MSRCPTFESLEARSLCSGTQLGVNLVVNGDFEASAGATSVGYIAASVPGWNTSSMAAVRYGSRGFPTDLQAPFNGGTNFLSGVKRSPLVGTPSFNIAQRIDVWALAGEIDAGRLSWDFAADLGGFGREQDGIWARVGFYNVDLGQLQATFVNGPTAAERGGQTGFRTCTATNVVPVGTRTIEIVLDANIQYGVVADGYADNVSLKLRSHAPKPKGFAAGFVYNDLNGNGALNESEQGLAGVTVYADLNKNRRLDATEPRATSGADGKYEIAGVRPGNVKVRQISPNTFRDTTGTRTVSVTGGSALSSSSQDFGNSQTVLISGKVFADNNGNGRRDAEDGGFAGIHVGFRSTATGRTITIATDKNGNFVFIAAPGNYTLYVRSTSTAQQSAPAQNRGIAVSLAKGQTSTNNIFGVRRI